MSRSAALLEAYATAISNDPVIPVLTFRHSTMEGGSINLVQAFNDMTLPLSEGGEPEYCKAAGIKFSLPAKSKEGFADLNLVIANTDMQVSDALKAARSVPNEPIITEYREYLKSNLTKPQIDPPIELSLSGAKISPFEVSATATVADIINKTFLSDIYESTIFKTL